jgi:hypothetical protein
MLGDGGHEKRGVSEGERARSGERGCSREQESSAEFHERTVVLYRSKREQIPALRRYPVYASTMAKAAKEKDKDAGGKSALDAAFRALQAGDAVGARRFARAVIAKPTPEDEAAVKRVSKALLGDDPGYILHLEESREVAGEIGSAKVEPIEVHPELLANDIIRRTGPIGRPYLWALGGALAYLGLLTMALVRYG